MSTAIDLQQFDLDGWTFLRQPADQDLTKSRLLVQIHGWTGDEKVMWIFSQKFPRTFEILSPRGPYPSSTGGYSWLPNQSGMDADLEYFRPSVEGLLQRIDSWISPDGIEKDRIDWIGFSQGAALVAALLFLYPNRIHRAALLSGFIPSMKSIPMRKNLLDGIQTFVYHGLRDDMVPVDRGRETVRILSSAGADVQYCEADTGHKLNLSCLYEMTNFFSIA